MGMGHYPSHSLLPVRRFSIVALFPDSFRSNFVLKQYGKFLVLKYVININLDVIHACIHRTKILLQKKVIFFLWEGVLYAFEHAGFKKYCSTRYNTGKFSSF